MNKILISYDKTIEYNEEKVKINNEFINDLEGKSAEAYAMNEMRSYYSKILSSHFENLVVLTGSGSSVDIGTDNKGKTMKGLWKCVIDEIGAEKLKGLCEKVKYEDFSEEYSDLEVLLSKSNTLRDFINDKSVNELIDLIQDVIVAAALKWRKADGIA